MRALRISLAVVIVLAGLFIVADRIAVTMAEDEVAKKIEDSDEVAEAGDISVSIDGFPFLTQMASQNLDKVSVDVEDVTARSGERQVTVSSLEADLERVRLEDGYSSATAEEATGKALITYDALTRASDKDVELGWGGTDKSGRGQIKVDADIPVLNRACDLLNKDCAVRATVGVDDDQIQIRATDIPGSEIPGVESAVRKKSDFDRKIDGLPSELALKKAEPTKKGIKLTVEGEDVPLNE